tara:strand:+ start:109 stop:1251 length:1143 start_codon:yes stop_codon:yes gene_type:complete
MKNVKLYFATNRKHEGEDRWNPSSYGTRFSSDGHENLRFGELTTEFHQDEVQAFVDKKDKTGRIGDGVGLSGYFTKKSKQAVIKAYQDLTTEAVEEIQQANNSSFNLFHNLKETMMEKGGKDVLIYIHGYNVSWDEAVGSALSLQHMLNSQQKRDAKDVVVVLFSWPSNGSMMPFAAYRSDRSDARDSGKSIGRGLLKLKDFLNTLYCDAKEGKQELCNQNIHLLCHSMGNYVLENGLKNKLIGYTKGSVLPRIFKNVFLCAPDVKDDALESGNGLSRLHEMASNVTIYYNDGDLGMEISKYTKSLSEKLGHTGNAHPALVHNKVQQVDCSRIVHGIVEHSYYLWATVNQDIAQSISGMEPDHKKRERKRNGQNREWVLT